MCILDIWYYFTVPIRHLKYFIFVASGILASFLYLGRVNGYLITASLNGLRVHTAILYPSFIALIQRISNTATSIEFHLKAQNN